MLSRVLQLLLAGCLMTGTLWAADNPFVGKWKVNPSKSMLNDEMKVEVAGANRYAFTFGPGQVDTVVADGSDQPALSGTTLSVTVKGPNSWEVVRKMKGRTLLMAHWTLSEDGKTLNDAFTQYLPDGTTLFSQPLPNGSTLVLPYVYERTAGNSGFPGTWDRRGSVVSDAYAMESPRLRAPSGGRCLFLRFGQEFAAIQFARNALPGRISGSESVSGDLSDTVRHQGRNHARQDPGKQSLKLASPSNFLQGASQTHDRDQRAPEDVEKTSGNRPVVVAHARCSEQSPAHKLTSYERKYIGHIHMARLRGRLEIQLVSPVQERLMEKSFRFKIALELFGFVKGQ